MNWCRNGVLLGAVLLLTAGVVIGCPSIQTGDVCGHILCGDGAVIDAADGSDAEVDFCRWDRRIAQANAVEACTRLVTCQGGFGDTTNANATGACIANAILAYDCTAAPVLLGMTTVTAFALSTVSGPKPVGGGR